MRKERSWTWRTWLSVMDVHQCVCHQPPCKLKYCPLKYKPIVSAAYLDPSQLVDVYINASYMKCQLWSIFVKYTSRALYLTDCELMSVECEIPFLKLLLSLAFFLWIVSPPGLLLHIPQASGLFYASVMFQLVFHLKSKALHLYCKNVTPRWQL